MEDSIVVYSTFYNPIEANIVKVRLEDSGIPCFLTDENVATIQPLYNQAIGGVKLNVFKKDVETINLLLNEPQTLIDDNAEDITEQQTIKCEKCSSTNVSFGQATQQRFSIWVAIVSLIFFVYPFKANKCYHCYDCGHEFK